MRLKTKDHIKAMLELAGVFGDKVKLIYSCDDEGNHFSEVVYPPSVGHFDGDQFWAMTEENRDKIEINAICIN